jgi:hypothetical protein
MEMGPVFDPRIYFKEGDFRLFSLQFRGVSRRPDDGFPWNDVGCRLVEKEVDYTGAIKWRFEDLSTGKLHGWFDTKCFSKKKLTEMEVLAWMAKR